MFKLLSIGAGVLVAHFISLASNMPSIHAAWGWHMHVPDEASFTCMEGDKIGCPGYGEPGFDECSDAHFTCTVKSKAGFTCDVETTTVVCSSNGGAAFQPKTGGACINIGFKNETTGEVLHEKNSELMWTAVPMCTADGTMTCGDLKGAYKAHSCCGNPGRRLNSVTSGKFSAAPNNDALLLEIGKHRAHIAELESKLASALAPGSKTRRV